jgi:hypothetical protein
MITYTIHLEGGHAECAELDARATLSTPVTSSEAAAAIAALRAALPDVPSDAAMQRACVALVARLLGVAP